jgi:hypothetical protein
MGASVNTCLIQFGKEKGVRVLAHSMIGVQLVEASETLSMITLFTDQMQPASLREKITNVRDDS